MNHEEQQLQKDEKVFSKQLAEWSREKESHQQPIHVMQTPLVLQLIGIKPLPIYIAPSTLGHIQEKHADVSQEILQQIPRALANPVMVFSSATVQNRVVVALDLKSAQGIDIVVPLALDIVRGRSSIHMITSVYGRGAGRGADRTTDYRWYINNIFNGHTLYVDKEKTKNFYQSARLLLPMEGKRFVGLFDSSIKTEEDLVKFKLQKEEEYKAAAAREAANEKDSSLQTQPVDKSHLQLRGTASYEPMVTDSIEAVNKEEGKMTAENQAHKEAVSDYADSYRKELANVCAASEESFTPAQNGKLKESADRLYKEMREFERGEGVCGPDQDAWDAFASLHERNVRSILAAKDISEATGRESKASEEAAREAVQSTEESIVFISRSRVDLLHEQKVYEDQIEELRRRVEDISEAKTLGVGKEEDFTRTLAAAAGFLKQIEGLRREAGNLPRKPASEMFKASRSSVRRAYFAVKLTPTQLRRHIDENMPQEVSRVLQQAAVAFEQGSESLGQAKEAIVRTARSRQSAAAFYREAWMEEAKASGISPEIEERVALRMAKAGMGAYTIRVTLERESPLREDMKAGKAKEIAEAAKAKAADAREAEREEDHRR